MAQALEDAQSLIGTKMSFDLYDEYSVIYNEALLWLTCMSLTCSSALSFLKEVKKSSLSRNSGPIQRASISAPVETAHPSERKVDMPTCNSEPLSPPCTLRGGDPPH